MADSGQLTTLRQDGGLGILIRQLVGLDRQAAKRAFTSFIDRHRLTADQTEFLNLVIDYLTDRGVMDPRSLYESPSTDLHSMGVEGLFDSGAVAELIAVLGDVRSRAAA